MIWARVRDLVGHHVGLAIMVACGLGFLSDAGQSIPTIVVPALLGIIIFFSCAKITHDDIVHISLRDVFGFYLLRFVALPVVVFYLASFLLPDYRFALLILLLLPCGATLPALMAVFGGNTTLGLGITVLTSFAVPFVLPFVFGLLSGTEIAVDIWGMFKMLALVIFVPVCAFFAGEKIAPAIKEPLRQNASFVAVSLISLVAFIIISSQRHFILGNIAFSVEALCVGFVTYMLLYGLGWVIFIRKTQTVKVSYALISGVNNIALGLSLAYLYLPEAETSILIIWELAWIFGLSGFQFIFFKRNKRKT